MILNWELFFFKKSKNPRQIDKRDENNLSCLSLTLLFVTFILQIAALISVALENVNCCIDDAELAKVTNYSDVVLTQLIIFIRNNVEDGEEFNMTTKVAVREGIRQFNFYNSQVERMHSKRSRVTIMTNIQKTVVLILFSISMIVFLIQLFYFAKYDPNNNVICLIHVMVYMIFVSIY
uniref:Uncharacterized protein n=1 Tax=Panagrolaimus sp. JU765 TaxID=591449 RepID=A0AC34RS14_9BILA